MWLLTQQNYIITQFQTKEVLLYRLTCFNFLYFQTKGKTWLIFGINFCDVQMKSGYYLKYSTNFFAVKSYITLCHQVYYDILALACLPLNQTFTVRNTSDKFCISVAKVAKIMDSGLKDTYIYLVWKCDKRACFLLQHKGLRNFQYLPLLCDPQAKITY